MNIATGRQIMPARSPLTSQLSYFPLGPQMGILRLNSAGSRQKIIIIPVPYVGVDGSDYFRNYRYVVILEVLYKCRFGQGGS